VVEHIDSAVFHVDRLFICIWPTFISAPRPVDAAAPKRVSALADELCWQMVATAQRCSCLAKGVLNLANYVHVVEHCIHLVARVAHTSIDAYSCERVQRSNVNTHLGAGASVCVVVSLADVKNFVVGGCGFDGFYVVRVCVSHCQFPLIGCWWAPLPH